MRRSAVIAHIVRVRDEFPHDAGNRRAVLDRLVREFDDRDPHGLAALGSATVVVLLAAIPATVVVLLAGLRVALRAPAELIRRR